MFEWYVVPLHSRNSCLIVATGLRIAKQYGNFYENAAGDMQFGTMDADKSVAVVFEHSHTLDERRYAFIQSATLYTTVSGERRVRVCNVALQVVTLAGNVFRYADMDTVVAYMLRQGGKHPSFRSIRETESGHLSGLSTVKPENQLHTRRADREVRVYSPWLPQELCFCDCTITGQHRAAEVTQFRNNYRS